MAVLLFRGLVGNLFVIKLDVDAGKHLVASFWAFGAVKSILEELFGIL